MDDLTPFLTIDCAVRRISHEEAEKVDLGPGNLTERVMSDLRIVVVRASLIVAQRRYAAAGRSVVVWPRMVAHALQQLGLSGKGLAFPIRDCVRVKHAVEDRLQSPEGNDAGCNRQPIHSAKSVFIEDIRYGPPQTARTQA